MSANSLEPRTSKFKAEQGRSVKEFFDQQASYYSEFYDETTKTGAAVLFQMRQHFATALLSGEGRGHLLDLATGSGHITRTIADAYSAERLHLNDISTLMLDTCRHVFADHPLSTGIEWSNEDAFALLDQLGETRYSVILCLGLIAHTGRLEDLLSKAYKALNSGGVLLIQSSLSDNPGAWLTAALAKSNLRRRPYKLSSYQLSQLLGAATANGFEIAGMRRFGICLPFGDRLLGRWNYRLEAAFAANISRRGGEVVLKLRRPH